MNDWTFISLGLAPLPALAAYLALFIAHADAKELSGWPGEPGTPRAVTVPEGCLPGEGHFARLVETISPDDAYVLGWGKSGASSPKYSEISQDSGERIWTDLSDESGENYLVDVIRGRIVGKLVDFHYFPGKQRHHLMCGWSPDGRAGVAMFQARWANGFESRAIAYIDPRHGKSYPIVAQMNAIVSRLWPAEVKRNDGSIPFFDPVMLDERTFVVDAFGWPPWIKPQFAWRLAFRVTIERGAPRVALIKRRPIPEEDDLDSYDGSIEGREARLHEACAELRSRLGSRDRRLLKETQARWLRHRALHGDSPDEFTRQRVRELLLRARWR